MTSIYGNVSAQDIIDKLSRKLCKCIEKKKIKNIEEMKPCFEDIFVSNFNEIKEYSNVESIEAIDFEEFGNKIGAKMLKTCPYMVNNFAANNSIKEDDNIEKEKDLKCNDLKNGDFYYLTPTSKEDIYDTTFVTISNDMYLERMKNGRTFSLLTIKWKKFCGFDLIFKESNDPIKKELSKPGDVYKYEVLTNNSQSIYLKTVWLKKSYQIEFVKIK